MRNLIFILVYLFSTGVVFSQNSFTEHLRKNEAGKGTVVIEQSAEIERVVNFKEIKKQAQKGNNSGTSSQAKKEAHEDLLTKIQQNGGNPLQPEKIQGYRIQVYAGPKSTGQSEARKIEQKCKKALPGISTYVRFIQPRWTCRIGDFQTREDANVFMNKLREANVSPQITIVRCQIFKVY